VGRPTYLPAKTPSDISSFCMKANEFRYIPLRAGIQYTVTAAIADECDPRGWTFNGGGTYCGPRGLPPKPEGKEGRRGSLRGLRATKTGARRGTMVPPQDLPKTAT